MAISEAEELDVIPREADTLAERTEESESSAEPTLGDCARIQDCPSIETCKEIGKCDQYTERKRKRFVRGSDV